MSAAGDFVSKSADDCEIEIGQLRQDLADAIARSEVAEAERDMLAAESRAEAMHADDGADCPVCIHLAIEQVCGWNEDASRAIDNLERRRAALAKLLAWAMGAADEERSYAEFERAMRAGETGDLRREVQSLNRGVARLIAERDRARATAAKFENELGRMTREYLKPFVHSPGDQPQMRRLVGPWQPVEETS